MMKIRMSGNLMNHLNGYHINCTTKGGIKGIRGNQTYIPAFNFSNIRPIALGKCPLLLYFIIIPNIVVVLYSNLKMEEQITVKKYPVGCGFQHVQPTNKRE